MSRSFNTQKECVKANKKIPRDKDEDFIFPRILERKAARGDQHPLTKRRLQELLGTVPVEYLYGLKAIELRGRISEIGKPFAYYTRDEKRIVLYSLPDKWELPNEPFLLTRGMWRHFVKTNKTDKGYTVEWFDPEMMGFWFYIDVFAHELGHHYRNQYRKKRKRSVCKEEIIADLHSRRFLFDLRRKVKKRKEDDRSSDKKEN